MMVWIDRNVYMERPWALEGAQGRLFIDEVRLREGFEKAGSSIRARGWWMSTSRSSSSRCARSLRRSSGSR